MRGILKIIGFCVILQISASSALAVGRIALFKYIDSDLDPILSSQPELRYPPEVLRVRYKKVIIESARRHKLNPRILEAIIYIESQWHTKAVSSKGAQGLMQLMPDTARFMRINDAFNPIENIRAGAGYFAYLMNLFDNNLPLALAAYHAGAGRVMKKRALPPIKATRKYVELVMRTYQQLTTKVD